MELRQREMDQQKAEAAHVYQVLADISKEKQELQARLDAREAYIQKCTGEEYEQVLNARGKVRKREAKQISEHQAGEERDEAAIVEEEQLAQTERRKILRKASVANVLSFAGSKAIIKDPARIWGGGSPYTSSSASASSESPDDIAQSSPSPKDVAKECAIQWQSQCYLLDSD